MTDTTLIRTASTTAPLINLTNYSIQLTGFMSFATQSRPTFSTIWPFGLALGLVYLSSTNFTANKRAHPYATITITAIVWLLCNFPSSSVIFGSELISLFNLNDIQLPIKSTSLFRDRSIPHLVKGGYPLPPSRGCARGKTGNKCHSLKFHAQNRLFGVYADRFDVPQKRPI